MFLDYIALLRQDPTDLFDYPESTAVFNECPLFCVPMVILNLKALL